MFEFPLLEVIQAIEELRETRGTTNQQICDFVRQQGRNPNDPMKILKTIRTLNKLVEEGVLIKKGKRYVFPTKPPELKEDEEEEKQDDDCEEEQGQDLDPDSCDEENDGDDDDEEGKDEEGDEGGKEEEQAEDEEDEDDDEEEDDEEDDDDDDDDDDGKCNEKDATLEAKVDPCAESGAAKGLVQQKSALNSGEPKATENVGDNEERTDKIASNTSDGMGTKKNSGRKNGKGQNSYATKNSNKGKNKGDFECDQIGRVFGMRKRESKSRKSRVENDCRSRSPIRGYMKNDYFTDLKLNHSEELRKNMISSQIFQEVTDTPMDIDNDNEVVDLDYDILRQRSPIGPPSAITPGVHLDRTESCCSQPTNKSPETTKADLDFDCKNQYFLKKKPEFKRSRHSMARAIDMQNKRLAAKEAAEKDKEKHKRELCSDEGNGIKTEKGASLCSVCEKKKRNS